MGHRYAERREKPLACHRSNDDCTQMLVEFRRRHDNARPGFLDLASDRWVKSNEPDLPALHQSISRSAAFPNSPSINSSSSRSATDLAACDHPSRAALRGLRNTIAPRSTVSSACSDSPTCANTGLGITIPSEFPIRRTATGSDFMVITMLLLLLDEVKGCGARHPATDDVRFAAVSSEAPVPGMGREESGCPLVSRHSSTVIDK
jgi:hypothetical protein